MRWNIFKGFPKNEGTFLLKLEGEEEPIVAQLRNVEGFCYFDPLGENLDITHWRRLYPPKQWRYNMNWYPITQTPLVDGLYLVYRNEELSYGPFLTLYYRHKKGWSVYKDESYFPGDGITHWAPIKNPGEGKYIK